MYSLKFHRLSLDTWAVITAIILTALVYFGVRIPW
jgi:hypothetical protein